MGRPRPLCCGALAVTVGSLLSGCDFGPAGMETAVRSEIHVTLQSLTSLQTADGPPTTVLDTVVVVVSPATEPADTLRGTFDERGEVTLDVSVLPGTVRFSASVISNNGTPVFGSDSKVRDIQRDGFVVELEVRPLAPALAVNPNALEIDALNPGEFKVINVGSGDLTFSADVVEVDPCGTPPCLVLEPISGSVAAGDSLAVRVTASAPGTGLYAVNVSTASGSLPVAVSVSEAPLPRAPDLAGVATPASIELTWSDPNDVEDLLRLERGTDGVHWSEIAILPAGSVAYSDIGIQPASRYYYRLRACALSVCSLFSNIVVVDTPDPGMLSTPTLFAIPVTDSRVDLTWSDNSTNETEFQLERSTDDGSTWTQLVALAPNTNVFADQGLLPGTYRYRIRACNSSSCSPYSNEASATLPRDGVGVPAPPSNAKAFLGFSADFIKVCWDDNSDNETEFQIERSIDRVIWTLVATVGENTVAYVDRQVKGPEQYFYRIRACNSGGCSTYSNEATEFVP